jgi:hypothetical protein
MACDYESRGLFGVGERMTDETRIYNCGGIPVELTLPEGDHKKNNYLVPFQDVMHAIYKVGDRKT